MHGINRIVPGDAGLLANRAIVAVYIAGLLCLLFSFGGVTDLPKAIGYGLIAISGAFAVLIKGVPAHTKNIFNSALIIVSILSVWIFAQTLPSDLLGNSVWDSARALGVDGTKTISVASGDTFNSILNVSGPFITFLAVLIIFPNDEDVRRALRIAAYFLSVLVLFGLIQYGLFPDALLFSQKSAYVGSLTSVFVNRNTAGTFLGLVALVFVVWFCEVARLCRLRYNLDRFANGVPLNLGRAHLELLAAAIMFLLAVLSLLLTQSRGAMASFVLAVACFIVLAAFYPVDIAGSGMERRRVSLAGRFLRLAIILGIAVAGLALFGGRTVLRAQVAGGEDARFCVLPGLLEMADDRWLTGWGFGTFRVAFSAYRDPHCGLYGAWVRAHNVYLEGYAGLGILFWPLVVVGVGVCGVAFWRGIRNRRSMRLYAHLGLCGMILTLLHSAIDFSLQIPGYAATFASFLALMIAVSAGKAVKKRRFS
ncbi:O-antigen ligase family protein [Pararhizobium antarcticum]|uniref:O-antigen ligase family protein n=1 Tax=Pararhizobium antarcticum TaxID=1798805 RepID=UPI000A744001